MSVKPANMLVLSNQCTYLFGLAATTRRGHENQNTAGQFDEEQAINHAYIETTRPKHEQARAPAARVLQAVRAVGLPGWYMLIRWVPLLRLDVQSVPGLPAIGRAMKEASVGERKSGGVCCSHSEAFSTPTP